MCKKITGVVESLIHDEIAERVKKERDALVAKLDAVSEKFESVGDEIDILENGDEDLPPADWKSKKRKIEKEFNIYFKKLREQAVDHIRGILAKNGLTEGNTTSLEELASVFFESDDHITWYNDVLPMNDKKDESKLNEKRKEYDRLDAEYDKINKEIEKLDDRVTKATGKICLQLMTGKNVKEIDDLIKSIKI